MYRNVFDAFLEKKFIISASNEILMEYVEKFIEFWGNKVSNNLLALFETRKNFEKIFVYYNWHLIYADKDDNKFIDAYIAATADFLVSNDSHIRQLKKNIFPLINILTLEEFSKLL